MPSQAAVDAMDVFPEFIFEIRIRSKLLKFAFSGRLKFPFTERSETQSISRVPPNSAPTVSSYILQACAVVYTLGSSLHVQTRARFQSISSVLWTLLVPSCLTSCERALHCTLTNKRRRTGVMSFSKCHVSMSISALDEKMSCLGHGDYFRIFTTPDYILFSI